MFRISLLVVAIVVGSLFKVQAQKGSYFNQPDKNGVDRFFLGGLVAGINASQMDGDNFSGFHKAGLNAGFISFIKLNPKMLLSVELLFSQKGARNVNVYNSPSVGSVPIIYTAKLNYAEIPVVFNYLATDKILFGAGLSYSRLFSDKESMDSYTSSSINNLDNTFRKQDINYLVSVAYQVYGNLFARARYQYSMLSIRDASKIPVEFGTPAQYNNLFALQLLLLF